MEILHQLKTWTESTGSHSAVFFKHRGAFCSVFMSCWVEVKHVHIMPLEQIDRYLVVVLIISHACAVPHSPTWRVQILHFSAGRFLRRTLSSKCLIEALNYFSQSFCQDKAKRCSEGDRPTQPKSPSWLGFKYFLKSSLVKYSGTI